VPSSSASSSSGAETRRSRQSSFASSPAGRPGPRALNVDVIGVQEFASVASGVLALDAIVKAAPVEVLGTRTVTPGKLVVLFTGDVASVEASLAAGRAVCGDSLIDELFIPNLHTHVIPAIRGEVRVQSWDALGIIESFSVTASIAAADIAAKEGRVELPEVRLAGGMGGKSYVKIMGPIEEVQAAVQAAVGHVTGRGLLCQQVIIPRPHPDIRAHVLPESEEEGVIWK
jgi:microcompartment protein CcmL/EutN